MGGGVSFISICYGMVLFGNVLSRGNIDTTFHIMKRVSNLYSRLFLYLINTVKNLSNVIA